MDDRVQVTVFIEQLQGVTLLNAPCGFTELVILVSPAACLHNAAPGIFAVEYFDHTAGMAAVFNAFADQQA